MSIRDEIAYRCADGSLVEMEPVRAASPRPRVLFAAKPLAEEIDNGFSASARDIGFRIGLLRNDIDRFTTGRLIVVGYQHDKQCYLKPLEPRREEVWEIRSRDPRPSIRVFGRFAAKDAFVATHMAWRDELSGWKSREWKEEIRRCKTVWRQLFFTYPPHSGSQINDYISNNVVEIGSLT